MLHCQTVSRKSIAWILVEHTAEDVKTVDCHASRHGNIRAMACPYFMPEAVVADFVVARAPLGSIYRGLCHATGEALPPPSKSWEPCNFGYGRGICPNFPANAGADAVRFTHYNGELIYILEKEYSPIEHGLVSTLDSACLLGQQAAIFASNNHS
jgi:hypothetical protein